MILDDFKLDGKTAIVTGASRGPEGRLLEGGTYWKPILVLRRVRHAIQGPSDDGGCGLLLSPRRLRRTHGDR